QAIALKKNLDEMDIFQMIAVAKLFTSSNDAVPILLGNLDHPTFSKDAFDHPLFGFLSSSSMAQRAFIRGGRRGHEVSIDLVHTVSVPVDEQPHRFSRFRLRADFHICFILELYRRP